MAYFWVDFPYLNWKISLLKLSIEAYLFFILILLFYFKLLSFLLNFLSYFNWFYSPWSPSVFSVHQHTSPCNMSAESAAIFHLGFLHFPIYNVIANVSANSKPVGSIHRVLEFRLALMFFLFRIFYQYLDCWWFYCWCKYLGPICAYFRGYRIAKIACTCSTIRAPWK